MKIEIPAKLVPVFSGPARYRGSYGGRGSAKTKTFIKMGLIFGMEKPLKILGCRELQTSIQDSIHAEVCAAIDSEPELSQFYKYGRNYVHGVNGTNWIYRGLAKNRQSLRSLADVDIAIVEEAEYISELSWNTLTPTIRKPGSEIWPIWNPERTDSATKKRFIDFYKENPEFAGEAKIVEMNFRDNPWFPDELEAERIRDQRRDPDRYLHTWEGQCMTRSDAQVLRGKWKVEAMTPDPNSPHWHGPYQGADWGFSTDPSVGIRCWVYKNGEKSILFIEYEAWGLHVETRDIGKMFKKIPGFEKYMTYGDCARPETISDVKSQGIRIEGCEKWDGSVEDGIEHMRGQYDWIVVHPRCVRTAQECQLYSHKVDKLTDEVLPDIIDKHNHCMDAIRYGIGKLIKRKPKGFFDVGKT